MGNNTYRLRRSSVIGVVWSRHTKIKLSVLLIVHFLLTLAIVLVLTNTTLVESVLNISNTVNDVISNAFVTAKSATANFFINLWSFIKTAFIVIIAILIFGQGSSLPVVFTIGGAGRRGHGRFYYL